MIKSNWTKFRGNNLIGHSRWRPRSGRIRQSTYVPRYLMYMLGISGREEVGHHLKPEEIEVIRQTKKKPKQLNIFVYCIVSIVTWGSLRGHFMAESQKFTIYLSPFPSLHSPPNSTSMFHCYFVSFSCWLLSSIIPDLFSFRLGALSVCPTSSLIQRPRGAIPILLRLLRLTVVTPADIYLKRLCITVRSAWYVKTSIPLA